MFTVPRWLTFLVAGVIILFGLYRMKLSLRGGPQEGAPARGGLYGLPRRTHLVFAIVYLVLGAFLIAAGFGVKLSPF